MVDSKRVFLCYRRHDTAHLAGRLSDRLKQHFELFMDTETIDPGQDFDEVIMGAISNCDVLLALIDRSWIDAVDDNGRRRLEDPNDWVVVEIRTALERRIRVIPVLVDGARMPRTDELPAEISGLTRRHSISVDPVSFGRVVTELIAKIQAIPREPRRFGPSATPNVGPPDQQRVLSGILLDGRYHLEERVGRGPMADVYRGQDELLGRTVAVKVFHRGLDDVSSVIGVHNVVRVLAKLHHPNLITVYDARLGVDHGDHRDGPDEADEADLNYLVMELVAGGTLAHRMTPAGMPPADVARVGAAVADALAAMHSHGLEHRDVKPANILISSSGTVKLSDVAVTELASTRLTTAGDIIGMAAYLSPEQARGGEVGPPTDVYALGLVLLECLTGHREFPGGAVESAVARLLRDPLVPETLPGSWPPLLVAMTHSDPARRPTAAGVEATLTGRAQTPRPQTAQTLPQLNAGVPAQAPAMPILSRAAGGVLTWTAVSADAIYVLQQSVDLEFASPRVIYTGPKTWWKPHLSLNLFSRHKHYRVRSAWPDTTLHSRWSNILKLE